MSRVKISSGFTIIELMLAMTFISMLLIAIALTTIQISNIYTKGMTLREVNQAGRSLSDELQRNISNTTPFDVTPKAGNDPVASKYVVHTTGGRLCLGNYTYAWNYGEALTEGAGNNRYTDNNALVRFVRVRDPNGGLCTNIATQINRNDAVELLASGDRELAVHKFSIQKTKEDAIIGQALYAISFVLGTNNHDQLLLANNASCRPPSDNVGDENYCAVNQFDIIARAGNASGGQQ
jgi:hypothetical protein